MESIIFTRDLEDQTVKEVKVKVVLECEISKEGLKVEWYKGTKKLRRDEKYDIVVEGKVHKLVIEKIEAEDAGEYSAQYQALKTACKMTMAGKDFICIDLVAFTADFCYNVGQKHHHCI